MKQTKWLSTLLLSGLFLGACAPTEPDEKIGIPANEISSVESGATDETAEILLEEAPAEADVKD